MPDTPTAAAMTVAAPIVFAACWGFIALLLLAWATSVRRPR